MTRLPLEFVVLAALQSEQAEPIACTLATLEPWRTLGYGAEVLTRSLTSVHPDLTRYLACRGGQALGLAVVRHPWLRGAYIELFAVLPEAQGQGVGGALLDRLENTWSGRAANLWLLVSGFNVAAQGFYLRQGFREIGIIPGLIIPAQDEVLMRKVL